MSNPTENYFGMPNPLYRKLQEVKSWLLLSWLFEEGLRAGYTTNNGVLGFKGDDKIGDF